MPSSIKLTEPLDILVEYGYLDDDTPYHKAVSNAVNDFSSDKTLGGEYNRDYIEILQKEARKELKARRKKIDVKSFKENFLNKKDKVDKSQNPPIDFDSPLPQSQLPSAEEEKEETEGLKGIREVLDEILGVLRLDFKGDRKEARDMQKEEEKNKRDKKEGKIEGGVKKSAALIGNSVKAMVKPFNSIWEKIINFLKFTLIGVLFNKTLSWFKDPENEKKAKRIGKFFNDWWPALAAAAALWLTPLGALLNGVVGLLTLIIPKLVLAIATNPYAALALVGTGLAVWGITSLAKNLGGDKEGENLAEAQNQSSAQLQDEGMGAGDAEVLSQSVTTGNVNRMTQGDTNLRSNTDMLQLRNDPLGGGFNRFNEGGLVQNYKGGGLINTYNNLTQLKNYKQGGFVSGPAGVDKVPARLTAGEFVMSKGAVQKFGINTLASMNASGGGTNVPTITHEYNQGGLVQYLQGGGEVNKPQGMMRWLAGAADVVTGGRFDFDKRGSVIDGAKRMSEKMAPGTPIVQSTNKTITLPTIKKEGQDIIPSTVDNPLPTFRIPIVSSQRSMVLSSLGIQDLIGE